MITNIIMKGDEFPALNPGDNGNKSDTNNNEGVNIIPSTQNPPTGGNFSETLSDNSNMATEIRKTGIISNFRGNKRSISFENAQSKKSKSDNDPNSNEEVFEVFQEEVTTIRLLREECNDLKARFKKDIDILKGHANDKNDSQLCRLIESLELTTGKFELWASHMHNALKGNKAPQQVTQINKVRRKSTLRSTTDSAGKPDLGNPPSSSRPTYSNIVADNLVKKGEVLQIPRTIGRGGKLPVKEKGSDEGMRAALEVSTKAITILNLDFGQTIRSKDVMTKVMNNNLMDRVRKKICENPDILVKEDDLYLLNDAIDNITHVDFKASSTSARQVKNKNGETKNIFTVPIDLHFYSKNYRNTFEKYLRIFSDVLVLPFWHPSLRQCKDKIKSAISESKDYISFRPINRWVVAAHKKDNQGKWKEIFVYDPIFGKYYNSITLNDGTHKTGSLVYRETFRLNRFWNKEEEGGKGNSGNNTITLN